MDACDGRTSARRARERSRDWMASASESGEGAASCDWAGRASSCSSMKSGAPGDAMWRRLALVIVTNSAGRVLVRQKRPACTARDIRSTGTRRALSWQAEPATERETSARRSNQHTLPAVSFFWQKHILRNDNPFVRIHKINNYRSSRMRLNERPNSPPYSTPRAFMVQLLFNSNLYPYPAGRRRTIAT